MKQKQDRISTDQQFKALNNAYDYFNKALFNGTLPGCILNFSRKKGTHGFLAPYRWKQVGGQDFDTHEISLTPSTLYREPLEVFSTLVHEMVHLWQFEFGKPSRGGYHNKEWAAKMEEVGLIPSDTGRPGGKRTGQRMTHYIQVGGPYEQAFGQMPSEYTLPFTSWDGEQLKGVLGGGSGKNGSPNPTVAKKKAKTKYSCSCGNNVWGKPELKIWCETCGSTFAQVS